jgi:hypothetical protein
VAHVLAFPPLSSGWLPIALEHNPLWFNGHRYGATWRSRHHTGGAAALDRHASLAMTDDRLALVVSYMAD